MQAHGVVADVNNVALEASRQSADDQLTTTTWRTIASANESMHAPETRFVSVESAQARRRAMDNIPCSGVVTFRECRKVDASADQPMRTSSKMLDDEGTRADWIRDRTWRRGAAGYQDGTREVLR
jgi:hypothetical protein